MQPEPTHPAKPESTEPALKLAIPPNEDVPTGYTEIQLAGEGTFSEIWKVRSEPTGRHFALKRLRPEFSNDEGAQQLLRNEQAAGTIVSGRHVVRVMQHDHDATPPYNLLEWFDGTTLAEALAAGEKLSVGTIAWMARQCAQGLNELAEAGYSHGDLKPENIFIATSGEIKLLDLGFAEPLGQMRSLGKAHRLTGTPEYMAPESCLRGASNPQLRDIYSLGIVLHQLLAGKLPFEAPTVERILRLHASARPPELRPLCPTAPDELINLVDRLLAKQPIRRPQSYTSLIRELTEIELSTLHARFAA